MSLLDAALALDDLAAGRTPDRATLLAGALALDTLTRSGHVDRDILDAAAGLATVATGGELGLGAPGRERAAALAEAVRNAAAQPH